MSFKFIIAHLKHKLTANNRHGTHSPFVYKLADEVIYDFSSKKVYKDIEDSLIKLSNDHKRLLIPDLKSSGLLLKSKIKAARITKLLYRIAENHKSKTMLLLSEELMINTVYLAKACPIAKIIALETAVVDGNLGGKMFEDLKMNNVVFRAGDRRNLFPTVLNETVEFDFAYINGRYTKAQVLNYFNLLLPKLNEHSLLIIADIYQNKDMMGVWEEIKNHPQVTVTIDLFWLGLVYFKKDQAKEHFKMKY